MPRQLVLSRVPVDLSIVEFDLHDEKNPVELFLTYTWQYGDGPGIKRDGRGPPHMDFAVGGSTAHPTGMRYGCWLIRADFVDDELRDVQREVEDLRDRGGDPNDIAILDRSVSWLENARDLIEARRQGRAMDIAPAHDAVFEDRYPGYRIIGQQGCGDLTMNFWTVAYVNNRLAHPGPRAFVRLKNEPTDKRVYSSLIKWTKSESGLKRMTIEDTSFNEPERTVSVRYHRDWIDRGSMIEFAIANQQVIRDGSIVPVVTTCRQFSDIRHLLQVPNLNPPVALYPGETPNPVTGAFRPRPFFGAHDVWLGEEALMRRVTDENLLRTALAGPLILHFPSGTDPDILRGAMTLAKYRQIHNDLDPLTEGDWRFVTRDEEMLLLEVYVKRNTYGFSMIGLDADNRKMFWLACTGTPGGNGYTIEQAAQKLLDAGAWNALLIDEGFDVMQTLRGDDGQYIEILPRRRRRMRATLIAATPAEVAS